MSCPACQGEVPVGARFCPTCASPLAALPPQGSADPVRTALDASLGFQYRIERLLGRGGMGAVYLAHELALDRDVAIKVLPPGHGDAADALERFRREARTAARLSHPNIVPLHTFGEVKGLVYFVMGYVRGEPLSARIKRSGRVGAQETRRLLCEIASALAYAHAQGVVHRDVKPDNILIDAVSGRPMLTDFGVAKARGLGGATLTATGAIVGTPHYMSPEQAAGRADIDGRSDLYSLGVVGYGMLSGRLPFEGTTPGHVLVQHLTQPPPPIQAIALGVPDGLAAAVMRCLAKDPAQRWPDAQGLIAALAPADNTPELAASLGTLGVCVQGLLALALLNGYLWLYGACEPGAAAYISRHPIWSALENLQVLVPLVGVMAAVEAKWRLKPSWGAILHSALLQPAWWPGWYPEGLRRPGDLWDRLPARVKRVRHLGAVALLAMLFLLVPVMVGAIAAGSYYERTGAHTALGALQAPWGPMYLQVPAVFAPVLVGLAFIVDFVSGMAWLRKRLGGEFEASQMPLLRATWTKTSPWRRPAYQALLRPAEPAAEDAAAPRSEDELERAVRRLAEALPPGSADLERRVQSVVSALRSSISALDGEIAALARDVDAPEAARLKEKLAALGPAAAAEPTGRQEMRDLLTKQLALMRGLAARLDEARGQRARRGELMRELWLRLSSLPREAQRLTPETTAGLRGLCAEIERAASRETPTLDVQAGIEDRPTLDGKPS